MSETSVTSGCWCCVAHLSCGCRFVSSALACVGFFSGSSPLLSPPHRVVWLWKHRVDITPQSTALHKDACLERELRLLTFSTQDGKDEEEEGKGREGQQRKKSPTAGWMKSCALLLCFLNLGDTFTSLCFLNSSWCTLQVNKGEEHDHN